VIQVQDVDFAYPVDGVSPDPDAVPKLKKSDKKVGRLQAKVCTDAAPFSVWLLAWLSGCVVDL
jgi:hypothetical protein